MEDPVSPTTERCYATFEQGYRSWYSLLLRAQEESRLPQNCFRVGRAFQQQPTFPRDLRLKQVQNTLCATGISNWEAGNSKGACKIPGFKQYLDIPVSVKKPTHLTLSPCPDSTASYANWFDNRNDHLFILILAWAYVLSARWAEVMPKATFQYSGTYATWTNGESVVESVDVDVGDVQNDAARWWAAVLAPTPGWLAYLTFEDTQFLCPWTVAVQEAPAFVLSSRNAVSPLSNPTAPASSKAVVLPRPNPRVRVDEHPTKSETDYIRLDWTKETRDLDKLLTLSCNIRGLLALLSSVFYDSSIPCNLASPWLQSAFAILNNLDDSPLLLAHVLMARVPEIAFLWLGAIIMGVHKDIFRDCRLGMIPIDLQAAAWSGTVQSFIQQPALSNTPPTGDASISRADECRLLYLSRTEHHSPVPICPWMPFGTTAIEDTDIEVRLHTQCKGRHVVTYMGWLWNCMNGEVVDQRCAVGVPTRRRQPVPPVSPIPVPYEALDLEEETISENATRSIFGWLRFEGYPPSERDIWNHPWMNMDASDYEEGCIEDHDSEVEAWVVPSDQAWLSEY
ncbi:hypothetical protein BJX96DRAFT_166867 [Aspergillus floccosus]